MHFHMSVLAITQAPSEQEKRPQTTTLGGEKAIHLGLSHLGRTSWRSASPPANMASMRPQGWCRWKPVFSSGEENGCA
jgi:hypothetical protein